MQWRAAAADSRAELQLKDELRRLRKEHEETVRKTIFAWGGQQNALVRGTVFLGWRDAVVGMRQMRKHAERGFFVMCQGDTELALRTVLGAWADHQRDLRQRQCIMMYYPLGASLEMGP